MDGMNQQWIVDHAGMIVLSVTVFVEWVALQALLVHYHFFRLSLKKPTPDGIRFSTIEKVLSFQASQIDRVYGKLGELNKEISTIGERKPVERMTSPSGASAMDASVMSLGEMSLKRRLAELNATAKSETAAAINNIKMN